jgi:hypothetical protein
MSKQIVVCGFSMLEYEGGVIIILAGLDCAGSQQGANLSSFGKLWYRPIVLDKSAVGNMVVNAQTA